MNASEENKSSSTETTPTTAERFPEFAGLTGKELLRASIRSQLSKQKENGSLPTVHLSSE